MKHRIVVASLFAAALGLALGAAVASAHEGDADFHSQLRSVRPAIAGLALKVVEGDAALQLTNRTGSTVRVPGYGGEPYIRVSPSGTVTVNVKSPANYLNQDRYGQTQVPPGVSVKARPVWKRIGGNSVITWHDHRIHWMLKTTPPQVKDESVRTKIFDWEVPLRVGQRRVLASGTLFWDPSDEAAEETAGGGGFDATPIAIGAVIAVVVLGGLAAILLRRRQRREGGQPGAGAESW